MDFSPPGSSVHEILQTRILEWVAIPFSRGSSWLRDQTWVFCIAYSLPSEPLLLLLSHFSCVWLCDPIDGSPPGSPIPGILQARTLEWVAISFSSSWKWKLKVKSLSCIRTTREAFFTVGEMSIYTSLNGKFLSSQRNIMDNNQNFTSGVRQIMTRLNAVLSLYVAAKSLQSCLTNKD